MLKRQFNYPEYRERKPFMGKHPKLISLISFVLFIFLNFYFITFTIELNGYIVEMDDLKLLLEDISYDTMLNLISVITTVLTTISFLFQYIIGKFLLIIFAPENKSRLFYALIPKVFIMILNIVFMGVLHIQNSWLYMFTALLGAVLILLFFQYQQ